MSSRIGWSFALLALTLGACSGSEAESDIRPFSEIATADPTIELDPSGTIATLNVNTSLDAICAVAYGIDGPSGAIATDQEMEVGGHTDHQAVMVGLQPSTTYQYRLQGVASDGNVYRSEIMTFTTAEAQESADHGTNVALGAAIVDVSSEFSDAFSASNAVDGSLGTEWSSREDGNDAFIIIDLGAPFEVTSLAFRTRSMGDGSATTETFTVDVDGETLGPFPTGENPSEVAFTGQILTFQVDTSTGGNTGAVEIEVYSR